MSNLLYSLFALCLLFYTALASTDGHLDSLEKLCRLDKKAPEVNTISGLQSIIDILKTNGSADCSPGVKDAILDLEAVLRLDNVCSREAVDTIVNIWAKYLDKKSELRANLPAQLKRFFSGYGLQVSKVCKTNLIGELFKVGIVKEITMQDVDIVTRSMRESKKVEKIFGKRPKLEDLMIIIKTDRIDNGERKKLISMPPKHKKHFELMQERCTNKFKPVYDTLFVPIIRLASIGLNYKDDWINKELKSMRQTRVYNDWFNAILACESIVGFEAVLIPSRKLTPDDNVCLATVLDEEDLADLREKTGLTLEEPAIENPIDYEVEAQVNDLILDHSNKALTKQLDHYGSGLKEMTKLRLRLVRSLPRLLRSMFREKSVRFGLKPVDTKQAGELVSYGSSMERKLKLKLVMAGLALAGITAGLTALLIVFVHPLWPLWIVIGGVVIMIIIRFIHKTLVDPDIWSQR